MPTISYLTANPSKIVCVGGVFNTDLPHSSFSWDEMVAVDSHKIEWSGDLPGEGTPAVVAKTEVEISAEVLEVEKDKALFFKLDEIDTQRENSLRDGELFLYDGHNYHIDRDALNLAKLVVYLIDEGVYPVDYSIDWKTADKPDGVNNTYVTLDKQGLIHLLASFASHSLSVWAESDDYKVAVKVVRADSESTPLQITSYDHTTGWE